MNQTNATNRANPVNLVWLRNDLRLDDNPALYHACQQKQPVQVIYCATPEQWHLHNEAPAKLGLRSDALTDIHQRLAQLGIAFELLHAAYYIDLPPLIHRYCRKHHITDMWFNQDHPYDEKMRDQAIVDALQTDNVQCHSCDGDQLVHHAIRNQQGNYYKVFTPWHRAWNRCLAENTPQPLPEPSPVASALPAPTHPIKLPGSTHYRNDLWPGSEQRARQHLETFATQRLMDYHNQRDFPALNGSSTLSPWLASGLISPRRCLQAVQQIATEQGADWRQDPWLRELGWREFYRYLMVCSPSLCKNQPFKKETLHVQWEHDPESVNAWQQGLTGFPIIDAGMRQLLRTGWMHNRLRMLTASFFSKLMLIDWRQGEAFFMQHLLDGDFASNNGGWQWSASTGCDASPWFRIFSPLKQSQRFDSEGHFIRKMIPELAPLDGKAIHNPPSDIRKKLGYPEPIIDYQQARQRVLARFKHLASVPSP